MRAVASLGVGLLLAGSAVNAGKTSPWDRYEQYQRELDRPVDARQHGLFLSEDLRAQVAAAGSPEEKRALLAQTEFPLWLGEVVSHHQSVTGDARTCLTLSGILADGSGFGTVAVEYAREHGELMIDALYYLYVDGPEQFPGEVRCPADMTFTFPP